MLYPRDPPLDPQLVRSERLRASLLCEQGPAFKTHLRRSNQERNEIQAGLNQMTRIVEESGKK